MAYIVESESRDDIWFNVNLKILTAKFLNNNSKDFYSTINQFPGVIYY